MTPGINRLHGRTFLQKDLCYEVFHRGYDNSVWNITNNYNFGYGCGGSIWGGLFGGIGMGLGAGLMGLFNNWMGGFGFGGGFGSFPMANWWGGGAGGSSSTSTTSSTTTTTTGGSRTYNNYSTTKAEKNHDRKPLNKLENRLGKLKKSLGKLEAGDLVSESDKKKFNELYIDVYNYTIQDSVDEEVDAERLKQFKADLEQMLKDHSDLTKPDIQGVKAQGTQTPAQPGVQSQAATTDQAAEQELGSNLAPEEKSLADRIQELDSNDLNGILSLYQEALGGGGSDIEPAENKFKEYIKGKSKDELEKLLDVDGIKGTALENIVRNAIAELDAAADPDKNIPDGFKGFDLKIEEVNILKNYIKMDTNLGCFKPIAQLNAEALTILGNHSKIKVAFANNPKAGDDTWIKGKVGDVEAADGVISSYTIDCGDGAGKYGLKFKVTKMKNTKNKYNVTCISDTNNSDIEHLYAANGGRIYTMGNDGVLHHADSRGTVISRYKKNGYTEIPKAKKQENE